jgi:hypothetical protein
MSPRTVREKQRRGGWRESVKELREAHTEHRTLHTEHRTLHPEHRTPRTAHRTRHPEHRTPHPEHRTLLAELRTSRTEHRTRHPEHRTPHPEHRTLHTEHRLPPPDVRQRPTDMRQAPWDFDTVRTARGQSDSTLRKAPIADCPARPARTGVLKFPGAGGRGRPARTGVLEFPGGEDIAPVPCIEVACVPCMSPLSSLVIVKVVRARFQPPITEVGRDRYGAGVRKSQCDIRPLIKRRLSMRKLRCGCDDSSLTTPVMSRCSTMV